LTGAFAAASTDEDLMEATGLAMTRAGFGATTGVATTALGGVTGADDDSENIPKKPPPLAEVSFLVTTGVVGLEATGVWTLTKGFRLVVLVVLPVEPMVVVGGF